MVGRELGLSQDGRPSKIFSKIAGLKGIKSKKSLYFGMPPFVAERFKARGSGPRHARGVGSNTTHLRAFAFPFPQESHRCQKSWSSALSFCDALFPSPLLLRRPLSFCPSFASPSSLLPFFCVALFPFPLLLRRSLSFSPSFASLSFLLPFFCVALFPFPLLLRRPLSFFPSSGNMNRKLSQSCSCPRDYPPPPNPGVGR